MAMAGALPPPSPTFCTRCEHNQLILRSARDGYEMPPDDHPDFEYHANVLFPKYMKDREARYPPMCAECIPRVKQKLKQVNYRAKVASLGHMLARSERPAARASVAAFGPVRLLKWAFWVARGAVWWWANALFLLWHLSAACHHASASPPLPPAPPLSPLPPPGLRAAVGLAIETPPRWADCARNSYAKAELDAACYVVASRDATRFFPWTLLGFWWLYRQWGVERHPDKKLVGGREYLHIEIAVALLRAAAWLLLADGGLMRSASQDLLTQVHAGFFFISVVVGLFVFLPAPSGQS